MKPILFSIIAFVIVISIASCTKDNSTPSPATAGVRPKTYTENVKSPILGNSINTYDLSYDGSGRILGIIPETPGGVKSLFQYNSNNSYTADLYNGTTLSIHEILFVNGQSLLDSTFQFNDTNDTTTEKYIYNQAGQLLTYKEYDYSTAGSILSSTAVYTYDNAGNVATITQDGTVLTYTYYTDLLNNLSTGQAYLQRSKNLLKTTSYTGNGSSLSILDTYTFDSSNRLITDSAVADNGDIIVKSYTY